MFPEPVLRDARNIRIYGSVASYSFGRIVDAVAVNALRSRIEDEDKDNKLCSSTFRPLSILLREGNDDPSATDACTVTLLELSPDPTYLSIRSKEGSMYPRQCPYLFPPEQKHRMPSVRGFTRCSNMFFGRVGTALWIQPRPRGHLGLTTLDLHSQEAHVTGPAPVNESLMATVFPGPLLSPSSGERILSRELLTNKLRHCVSMDYDEESGVIALGNHNGDITVLEL